MEKGRATKMTKQELLTKYDLTEPELYVFACKYLKDFQKCAPHERGKEFNARTLRQLERLLEKGREDDDMEWIDPADEEPDDNEVDFRTICPEEEPADGMNNQPEPEQELTDRYTNEKIDRLEAEKADLAEQASTFKQELAALRDEFFTAQRNAAAEKAELLAQAGKHRKNAETTISALKEDIAAQKQLASVRIKEVEDRNEILEQQLKKTQEEYNLQSEELINLQHAIQDLREAANKKGTQQAMELLDAQGQQEKLAKTIHEKDLEIMEAKEKQQEIVGKYNAALQRTGEIIAKIMKTRERMKESFAEFDVYIDAEKEEKTAAAVENADNIITAANEPPALTALEMIPSAQAVPNPKTVEILGQPVGETPTGPEAVIREQAKKPSLWRRIASFF